MIRLYVNGQQVDVDSDTKIGVDLKTTVMSDPGERKMNASNKFSVPFTATNRKLFGFLENVFSKSSTAYDEIDIDMWSSSFQIFKEAKGIVAAKDRYEIAVTRNGMLDTLAGIKMRDVIRSQFDTTLITGSSSLATYYNNQISSGVVHPFLVSVQRDDATRGFIKQSASVYDGIMGLTIDYCLKMIEDETGFTIRNSGTIIDTAQYANLYLHTPELVVQRVDPGAGGTGLFETIFYDQYYGGYVGQIFNYQYFGDKSALDFLKSLAQIFNAIIDTNDIAQEIKIVPLYFITGLKSPLIPPVTSATTWTGKVKEYKLIRTFGKYGRNNKVKQLLEEGVDDTVTYVEFASTNVNLEGLKEFEIENIVTRSYVDAATGTDKIYTGGSTNGEQSIFTTEPFDGFFIFEKSGISVQSYQVSAPIFAPGISFATRTGTMYGITHPNALGSMDVYYQATEELLQDPLLVKAEMNLDLIDFSQFKADQRVYIQELAGNYYVNKISKFVPGKAGLTTTVELIRIDNG